MGLTKITEGLEYRKTTEMDEADSNTEMKSFNRSPGDVASISPKGDHGREL